MMRSRKLSYYLHKLKVGARLRCPDCEQGKLFERKSFQMNKTCPYCHSRFERAPGDVIGGIYINLALAELSALTGFLIVHALFQPPITHQLYFWIPYLLIFCAVFYRHARGLWVAYIYLTGGVYPDQDYEREYIARNPVTYGKTTQEHE